MPNPLQGLRDALRTLDDGLRAGEKCDECHKPISGFVPVGVSLSEAGLCTCERADEVVGSPVTSLSEAKGTFVLPPEMQQAMHPEFEPTRLMLKHEDQDEETGGAYGPLYYVGKEITETCPVFLDLEQPFPGSKYGYFPVWVSYADARKIARELNLPLEEF